MPASPARAFTALAGDAGGIRLPEKTRRPAPAAVGALKTALVNLGATFELSNLDCIENFSVVRILYAPCAMKAVSCQATFRRRLSSRDVCALKPVFLAPAVEIGSITRRQLAQTPEDGYVIRNFFTPEIQFRVYVLAR